MYYLKCQSCGFFNPVRTEYLCFCVKCNKKIEKNFQDWQKVNNSGNFNDFLKQVCVQEKDTRQLSIVPKKKKIWLPVVIILGISSFLTLGVILFFAISNYLGKDFISQSLSGKTSKEVLDKPWVTNTYYKYGISIESPEALTPRKLELPDNIHSVIEDMESFSYETNKGFKIIVNMARYNPSVQTSLMGGADGAIAELKSQNGVEDVLYSEKEFNRGSIQGILQLGTFRMFVKQVEFKNAIFVDKSNFWQVTVVYGEADDLGRRVAEKIINSIEIEI